MRSQMLRGSLGLVHSILVKVPPVQRPCKPARRAVEARDQSRSQQSTSTSENNPDFDNLQLNEEYYNELGLTPEQAAEQLEEVWNVDPDGYRMLGEGGAEHFDDAVFDEEDDNKGEEELPLYGPAALVLAGFRDHELAMVRVMMDSLGGHSVKVIPCTGPLLYGTVAEALQTPEPDWEQPLPAEHVRSGDWGSQRTLLFSGLGEEDMLIVLDMMEEGGLPTLMVAVADPTNANKVLGEVLAVAVKNQRGRKLQKFDMPNMMSGLPDLGWSQEDSEAFSEATEGQEEGHIPAELAAGLAGSSSGDKIPEGSSEPTMASTQTGGRAEQVDLNNSAPNNEVRDAIRSRAAANNMLGGAKDVSQARSASQEQMLPPRAEFSQADGIIGAQAAPTSAAARSDLQPQTSDLQPQTSRALEADSSHRNPTLGDLAKASGPSTGFGTGKGFSRAKASGSAKGSGPANRSGIPKVPGISRHPKIPRQPESSIEDKASMHTAAAQPSADPAAASKTGSGEGDGDTEEKPSFEDIVKSAGKEFMGNIAHNTEGREQRVLKEAAAEEMQRRAEAGRAQTRIADQLRADNLIDAVASGQASTGGISAPADDEAARQRMEAMLEQLKANAAGLPDEQRRKLADDLKVLESDKESVEKVLSELSASLDSIPKNDRGKLKDKLREEAWQPTKDAIGAALACGITPEEMQGFINQAVKDKAEERGGWFPTVSSFDQKEIERMGGMTAAKSRQST